MRWHRKGSLAGSPQDERTGRHFTFTVKPRHGIGYFIEVHHYETAGAYPFHAEVWESDPIHDVTILQAEVARLTGRLVLDRDPV